MLDLNDLAGLSLDAMIESDYVFKVNNPRGIITMDAQELDTTLEKDIVTIYIMYNLVGRKPMLINVQSDYQLPDIVIPNGFVLSYDNPKTKTYIIHDAFTMINAENE